MLAKLNTFPKLRRQIKSWLKSGVLEDRQWFPTEAGTPQGGTASPLLANIALHGMENRIKQAFPKRERRVNGQKVGHRQPPHLIRYADDFVVLHEDLDVVQQCQQILIDWLAQIGLKLHPDKTRITHTLHPHEGRVGFDFLGFTVRQFPAGQYRTAHNSYGKPLGFKTLIKPSQTSIRRHQWKLKQIIYRHQASTQLELIDALNPVVIGWSNYFRSGVSSEIFSMLDHWLFYQLKYWAFHRHPRKNPGWIVNKYWLIDRGEGWRFALKTADPRHRLAEHKDTAIQRHTKVQGQRSPFDADWLYWSSRMGHSAQVSPRVARLLKRQKGMCSFCGLYFHDGDRLETDHIIPRSQGGKDDYLNLQLLHRHCHDVKSAQDGSDGMFDTHQNVEEPDESKRFTSGFEDQRGWRQPR